MAALHEKYLWPLIGVVIFAVLAAFYIDDRRRLAQDTSETTTSQHDTEPAANDAKPASNYNEPASTLESVAVSYENNSGATTPPSMHATDKTQNPSSHGADSSVTGHQGFSGSIQDYLAQISTKNSAALIAAADDHQGFSGSIGDYLHGGKSTATFRPSTHNSLNTSPLSKDAYSAKESDDTKQAGNTYSGSIEEYLARFGESKQTPISSNQSDPFQLHQGFSGSYEDYAKQFNEDW